MILSIELCCDFMDEVLTSWKTPLNYSDIFREYRFEKNIPDEIGVEISFCPWCGAKLCSSLKKEYFELLQKEYKIGSILTIRTNKTIPKEFKSDQWWKKRGLYKKA